MGFVFDEMSHRGSLLCLPDAVWAWPIERPQDIDRHALSRVFEASAGIDTLIIGTGKRGVAAAETICAMRSGAIMSVSMR